MGNAFGKKTHSEQIAKKCGYFCNIEEMEKTACSDRAVSSSLKHD